MSVYPRYGRRLTVRSIVTARPVIGVVSALIGAAIVLTVLWFTPVAADDYPTDTEIALGYEYGDTITLWNTFGEVIATLPNDNLR